MVTTEAFFSCRPHWAARYRLRAERPHIWRQPAFRREDDSGGVEETATPVMESARMSMLRSSMGRDLEDLDGIILA